MLVPYFDPRGSGADREGYVQRRSNEEGSGTIIHRVVSPKESAALLFFRLFRACLISSGLALGCDWDYLESFWFVEDFQAGNQTAFTFLIMISRIFLTRF